MSDILVLRKDGWGVCVRVFSGYIRGGAFAACFGTMSIGVHTESGGSRGATTQLVRLKQTVQ